MPKKSRGKKCHQQIYNGMPGVPAKYTGPYVQASDPLFRGNRYRKVTTHHTVAPPPYYKPESGPARPR